MNYRQFEQTPDGLWRLGGEGVGFELDKPVAGLFTLTPFDGLTVTSLEAVPGEYPESMALVGLRRPHHSPSYRYRGNLPERKIPVPEQGHGHEDPEGKTHGAR